MVINGGGGVTLNAPNGYSGGTTLNSGTLNINSPTAIGTGSLSIAQSTTIDNTSAGGAVALTTNNAQNWNGDFTFAGTNDLDMGAGPVATSASRLITTNGTGTLTVGAISGSGFNLTKAGIGRLRLSGANTYTGLTTVSNGTLDVTGSISAPASAANTIIVGNTTSVNAVLSISGGSVTANGNGGQFTSPLLIGSINGSYGDVRMTSGTLTTNAQLGLGAGVGSYAAYSQSGGTASIGSFVVVGFATDLSVANISGGTLTLGSNLITVAAGTSTATGVVNISGGTVNSLATTGYGPTIGGMFVGEFGSGTLNVSGTGVLNLSGWGLRLGHNTGATGTVNLLTGGTINTVSASLGSGTGTLNFNGGTLKASGANTAFMPNLTNAYVYPGGAVIDDGGFAITISQNLLAPPGSGLSRDTSGMGVSGGTGFIDTPIVSNHRRRQRRNGCRKRRCQWQSHRLHRDQSGH